MDFITEPNRIFMQDEQGKILAEVRFPNDGKDAVAITSTRVDDSLKGQGIADQLLKAVIAELQAQGKQTRALCSYAVKWFEKNPEYQNLLIKD